MLSKVLGRYKLRYGPLRSKDSQQKASRLARPSIMQSLSTQYRSSNFALEEEPLRDHPQRKSRSTFWHRVKAEWNWQSNVQVALAISIITLIVNLVLLIIGLTAQGDSGIGTLHRGTAGKISRLGTVYHVLINVLSTSLLTSSNYCMQLLCAPTRGEIDAAHTRGRYFDIGVLSVRNVRFLPRARAIMWMLLCLSSVPLHLLYNSAIFSVTAGQDYNINFLNANDTAKINQLSANQQLTGNSEWMKLYNTQYVPDCRDLTLVLDSVSFAIVLTPELFTWRLELPSNDLSSTWSKLSEDALSEGAEPIFDLNVVAILIPAIEPVGGTFNLSQSSPQRQIFSIDKYNQSSMPIVDWPETLQVEVSQSKTWSDIMNMSSDGWLYPPWHVQHAFVEKSKVGSELQISIYFMAIVLLCNAIKMSVISLTLRGSYSGQIITQGDAIASFLERPDPTTISCCTATTRDLIDASREHRGIVPKPWQFQRSRLSDCSRGHWLSLSVIAIGLGSGSVGILFLALRGLSAWGSASTLRLSTNTWTLNPRGILFMSWLANSPQLALSIFYISINRLCTSMCFTNEWNKHALTRNGLRVTRPQGQKQRRTRFLQLPYRWAVPLTLMSGSLHLLLSQSLFLVRQEAYDRAGNLQTATSVCTCGYSTLSLLSFLVCFFLTLAYVIVHLQMPIVYSLVPAQHCSLVISAACHPPPDDVDPQLHLVQWGVVRNRFGGEIEHCSFTSESVSPPQEGKVYT